MACHLAGVPDRRRHLRHRVRRRPHRVLRRLLLDHDEFRGEVIFTFDGDAAGQKAALRAFEDDQRFVAQTYVAVEPDGLDPCDLRLPKGDAPSASWSRRPRSTASCSATSSALRPRPRRRPHRRAARGRQAGLRIRDRSKVDAFARELAGMLGIDTEDVPSEVRRAARGKTPGRPCGARGAGVGRRTA